MHLTLGIGTKQVAHQLQRGGERGVTPHGVCRDWCSALRGNQAPSAWRERKNRVELCDDGTDGMAVRHAKARRSTKGHAGRIVDELHILTRHADNEGFVLPIIRPVVRGGTGGSEKEPRRDVHDAIAYRVTLRAEHTRTASVAFDRQQYRRWHVGTRPLRVVIGRDADDRPLCETSRVTGQRHTHGDRGGCAQWQRTLKTHVAHTGGAQAKRAGSGRRDTKRTIGAHPHPYRSIRRTQRPKLHIGAYRDTPIETADGTLHDGRIRRALRQHRRQRDGTGQDGHHDTTAVRHTARHQITRKGRCSGERRRSDAGVRTPDSCDVGHGAQKPYSTPTVNAMRGCSPPSLIGTSAFTTVVTPPLVVYLAPIEPLTT